MKLVTCYQPAKFQISQLSESNFTEVFIRHPRKPLRRHYDVTSRYLAFKIVHFVELNKRYQPARFHWSGWSGSNFTRAGGKHPPRLNTLSKSPVLIGLEEVVHEKYPVMRKLLTGGIPPHQLVTLKV